MNKCKTAFLNGQLMFGPRGGEYILVLPKLKHKKKYKRYCKIKESNKKSLTNQVLKGYRPK